MSSTQCSHCQRWFSNHCNLMYHMASCPEKCNNNEDSRRVMEHHPLKSTYDYIQPTKNSFPSVNEFSTKLCQVEIDKGRLRVHLRLQCNTFAIRSLIAPLLLYTHFVVTFNFFCYFQFTFIQLAFPLRVIKTLLCYPFNKLFVIQFTLAF